MHGTTNLKWYTLAFGLCCGWKQSYYKEKQVMLISIKEIGLKVPADKTKYMVMS